MQTISCPIPDKSLIVQFEPGAAASLEERATRHPAAESHGLVLGSVTGSDPKSLVIQQLRPVFGFGHDTEPPAPVDPAAQIGTLGYYSIRNNADTLDSFEREFLASSLPASASIAMVFTGNPDRRILAQFYVRDPQGAFEATPVHREVLQTQEVPPAAPDDHIETPYRPRSRWPQIGAIAALGMAAFLTVVALIRQPARMNPPAPVTPASARAVPVPKVSPPPVVLPVVSSTVLLPRPDFELPVKSIRQIPDPPEVAIRYAEPSPAQASAQAQATEAGHAVLVRPVLSQENPQ